MQEDLTRIKVEVLNRFQIEKAEALREVSVHPDDRIAQRRLRDLEHCIEALESALKFEPRMPRGTTVE